MITLTILTALVIAFYFGVRLPAKVATMTDEEYRQYFMKQIMGL